MAVSIKSGNSGDLATVNTNKQLEANLPLTIEQGGFATMSSEKDSGTITGYRYCLSPEVSEDYRLRVGLDTYLDNEVFNYSAQNTAKHKYYNTSMAISWGSGYMSTNSGNVTTANSGVLLSTYRVFPVIGTAPLYCEINAAFTAATCPTNTTIDFGLFTPTTSATPYAPLDGVFFRMTLAGLQGVLNYGGNEISTSVFAWSATANANHHFAITLSERTVEFWIDEVLMSEIETQVGYGQPLMSGSVPFSIRHAIGSNAASGAYQFKIADKTISLADFNTSKTWSHQLASACGMSYQGQSGQSSVLQTCSYPIDTNPSSGALSRTALATTGLGGQFAFNQPNSTANDFLLMGYQNPIGSTTYTAKNLYIMGVILSDYVDATLGNPGGAALNLNQYNLIFGAGPGTIPAITVVADTQNSKAWRTIPLGFVSYARAAPTGTVGTPQQISVDFIEAPIVVMPGEWIGISVRCIFAPGTGAGAFAGIVTFKGYWE